MKQRKNKEELMGIPTVVVRNSYLRIFPGANGILGATTDDNIDVEEEDGQYRIAILPSTSSRNGYSLHRSNETLQTHSKAFARIPHGTYTLKEPEYDEQEGIDWYALVKTGN